MVGASFCFAVMGALVKWAGKDLPSLVVVFGRSFLIVLLAAALVRSRGISFRVVNRRLMLWRCFIGFLAMVLYFYALGAIPLGMAVTLQYLNPVFVALFAGLATRERVSLPLVAAILAAFLGAAMVMGPDLGALSWGAVAALASAALAALAYLAVRELRTTDSPEIIVLSFAVFATIGSAPGLLLVDRWPSAALLLLLAGVGVFAFLGQMLLTYAYRVARAPFVSAFSYSTVIFGATIGLLFFDESLSALMVAGALTIIAAGLVLSWLEIRE